jgi:hypothetical protein
MAVTATKTESIQRVLNSGDINRMPRAFQMLKAGAQNAVVKVVVSGLTATATPDITSAAVKAAAVISGIDLDTGENLPPIGSVLTLRCTTSGTPATVGSYVVGDAGSTPLSPSGGSSVGLAKLSDDGKVLTFPTTITGFELHYTPRGAVPVTSEFAPSS